MVQEVDIAARAVGVLSRQAVDDNVAALGLVVDQVVKFVLLRSVVAFLLVTWVVRRVILVLLVRSICEAHFLVHLVVFLVEVRLWIEDDAHGLNQRLIELARS